MKTPSLFRPAFVSRKKDVAIATSREVNFQPFIFFSVLFKTQNNQETYQTLKRLEDYEQDEEEIQYQSPHRKECEGNTYLSSNLRENFVVDGVIIDGKK